MKSDTPLDYAAFQLSPKRCHCELVISGGGNMEKLASGLVKPFLAHLRVAEEQVGMSAPSIKLELECRENAEVWFNKGTLERFVRFVSTPEVLELANTFDAEMSQLESARRIYSQGTGELLSGSGAASGATEAADATKKELLRAIDVRLLAVQQDLTTACAHSAAAGFNPDTVLDLQKFAARFGALRLNEACGKFISLCERRPELVHTWKVAAGGGRDDHVIRSSYGSDMSIEDEEEEPTSPDSLLRFGSHQPPPPPPRHEQQEEEPLPQKHHQHPTNFTTAPFKQEEERSKQNDPPAAAAEKEKKKQEDTNPPDQPPHSIALNQPSRRLSVQDRINLFENKQKENSGGKPAVVVGKTVEIKRLSSDVSSSAATAAIEKAVLRRWSGASDMSIDLSGEKKDTESPLCTPSSSSSHPKSEDQKDTAGISGKSESRSIPRWVDDSASSGLGEVVEGKQQSTVFSDDKSGEASQGGKLNSTLGVTAVTSLKDQPLWKSQSSSFLNRAEDNSLNVANSELKFRSWSIGKIEEGGSNNQPKFKGFEKREDLVKMEGQVHSEVQIAGHKDKGSSRPQIGHFAGKGSHTKSVIGPYQQPIQAEPSDQKEEVGTRDDFFSQTFSQTQSSVGESAPQEASSGSRIRDAFAAQYKGAGGITSSSQMRPESFLETENIQKKEFASAAKHSGVAAIKLEETGPERMKFEKQVSAPEPIKKTPGRKDDSDPTYGSNRAFSHSKVATDNQDAFNSFSTLPPEYVRVRQSKGNQELNDELNLKANELEKLFAEYRLRAPGDQSNTTWRTRPVDRQNDPPAKTFRKSSADTATAHLSDDNTLSEPAESLENSVKFGDVPVVKVVGGHGHDDSENKKFSELNFPDGSRGKLYERYMQKRDAKLREDWSSNRAEKEAKLKAMQDSLERSKSEMKAKFSGSPDRQDSAFSARRRAERLRSFNRRSIMRREQQQLDFGQSDDDEDASDFQEHKLYREDGSFTLTSVVDGLPKSKKCLSAKSLSSTTRVSAAPIPRSATRTSSISGRHKMQYENPLAISVPNFSDLRKENTKPSLTASRTTRPQLRNYTRSKSANEDALFVKEEMSRRSQYLRKSSANSTEHREPSPLNSESISLTTHNLYEDETVKSSSVRYLKTSDSKPFLKKDSGMNFGARTAIVSKKTKITSDTINDEDDFDGLDFEAEDPADLVKDEEEFETAVIEHQGEPELDQEPLKLNFGAENGVVGSFAQLDSSLVVELTSAVSSGFHTSEIVQDSPGESPLSWNSRTHNPFSYSHEMSDIDASVDSPAGSPVSWNSHSLSQTENDAARMRKKWGAAQKPMLVGNSSHNQSRKDMTRGFKRLLKFGRKSRGAETLVDWISATTSEGDDDTEDARDPANRSSEDLRKSRMGSLQGHPSDDSFNESEFFSERVQPLRSSIPAPPANFKLREDHVSGSSIKAPRSFFSLSSFRSKGSESKLR